MHVGLIVGIAPAATDCFDRYLVSRLARAGRDLTLTVAHADTLTLLRYEANVNLAARVDISQAGLRGDPARGH